MARGQLPNVLHYLRGLFRAPAANFSEQFGKKLYARRGDPA